jgi:hypothetical protein
MMKRWLTMKNLFALFLVVWFAYGVWEARGYGFLAKIFPFYVSLVLLVLALVSLAIDIVRSVRKAGGGQGTATGSDLSVDWDMPMSEVYVAFLIYVGIIVGVYVAVFFIGYPVALSLFIFLFYRFVAKAGWIASLIAGAAGLGFMALASHLLGMDWPDGLMKLPWPFG